MDKAEEGRIKGRRWGKDEVEGSGGGEMETTVPEQQ